MRRILARMTGPARGSSPGPRRDGRRASSERAASHDERVLAAMGAIPREAFVPDENRRYAYADEALPIDAGQTISQPVMVAKMTEHLHVQPGDRILEIGTGSGYQAAILAWLGAARHVARAPGRAHPDREGAHRCARPPGLAWTIREADGSLGDAAGAPWDGIIVTAAAPVDPARPARAARRGRPAGHPRRFARSAAPDDRHPARQRLARGDRRLLRLRPAHRRRGFAG